MQYQGIDEQRVVNTGLLPMARDLDLPFVCTNDVHYLRQKDRRPHDVLLCIGTGKNVSDEQRLRYHGDQFYLKTGDEMRAVFGEYADALANTVAIAERCDVELAHGESHLPNFDVPAPFTLDGYFEHVTREGFEQRREELRQRDAAGGLKHPIADYEARLAYEIDVITRMRYPGYFLIVWDFIRYAREQKIPVGPGRRSAAGSLVAWCLRITDVDLMQFDLIFERFLNPERVSLPDIDIDFCERRRGEMIEYVTRKYGRDNVAQIITFGTMKARAVVRDVGRTMGLSFTDVDRVAKQIPPALNMTLDKALKESSELKALEEGNPEIKELVSVARRLEGITRHASVHAAGVVITPRPVTEFAPVYKSQKDEISTQWAMKQVERMGLLKMDFLGLSTLTLLRDAIDHVQETTGESIALEKLPLDDEKTFQLFCDGQTLGVFQFESSGMRDTLRKAKPQRFEDLIALNALYRPGPLQGGVVDRYIERRHGREAIEYDAPGLEPILRNTYGVIAYQEQVMRIAGELAGFTMGDADLLRKAMGKKDASVMEAQREKFIEGAVARDVPREQAVTIFNFIEFFAGYGFNKSHATTYALIAYHTAWLKANHPRYFMAALMTIEAQNTDKLATYLGECRDMDIPVLAPDINTSATGFRVEPDGVRFGLTAVKNVGENAIGAILGYRSEQGRVDSLFRLCEEIDLRVVNKRVFENLVKAGAFDSVLRQGKEGPRADRPQLLAILDRAIDHGSRVQRDPGANTVDTAAGMDSGVFTGGIVGNYRTRTTKAGTAMAVFTLEDRTDSVEVVVFPKTYERCGQTLEPGRLVIVAGRLDQDEELPRLMAEDVQPIENLEKLVQRTFSIRLSGKRHKRETLQALADLFERHRGPTPVILKLELPEHQPPLRVHAQLSQTRLHLSQRLARAAGDILRKGRDLLDVSGARKAAETTQVGGPRHVTVPPRSLPEGRDSRCYKDPLIGR